MCLSLAGLGSCVYIGYWLFLRLSDLLWGQVSGNETCDFVLFISWNVWYQLYGLHSIWHQIFLGINFCNAVLILFVFLPLGRVKCSSIVILWTIWGGPYILAIWLLISTVLNEHNSIIVGYFTHHLAMKICKIKNENFQLLGLCLELHCDNSWRLVKIEYSLLVMYKSQTMPYDNCSVPVQVDA